MKNRLITIWIVWFMAIGGFLGVVNLVSEEATADTWSIETVDSDGDVGYFTSIALDDNGYQHISYQDWTNKDLKYVRWDGVVWSIETVDSEDDVGEDCSIALDSNDYPHIAYVARPSYDLKYARWTGSVWNIETVDFIGDVGTFLSLALDSNDYPHISYWDDSLNKLKYAKWTGSDWSTEIVDYFGVNGICTSIAMDSNDYPHISYAAGGGDLDLMYARWDGTEWSIEIVDSDGDVGWSTSIVLDSGDYAHISYYDRSYQALKYARWTGSDWSIETVDMEEDVGQYSSIVLDSSGYAHISYYYHDESNDIGGLKYARWTGSHWAFWYPEFHSSLDVGRWPSIALNSTDSAHISYYDVTNGDLKYAKCTNYPPNTPIKPSGSTTGEIGTSYTYSSIATDPDGDQIKYTFDWDDGSQSETGYVDSGTSVSEFYSWSIPGTYYVNVRATDTSGERSEFWSERLTVTISEVGNSPPNIPSTPSGPTSGDAGTPYAYSTSATDPDGDQVKYTFDWGDGTTSETGYVDSGTSISKSHTWNGAGTYYVKTRAIDINDASSGWSNSLTVTISSGDNNLPKKPSTPSGPTNGEIEISYSYSTSSTDPDGDQLKYTFDWGDGTTSETGYVSSGTSSSLSHSWSSAGTYHLKAKATDINGASSGWSNSLMVTISSVDNTPPNSPNTPSGPTSGTVGASYTYSTSATDLDGDQIKYTFDWGDGTTSETGHVNSGTPATESHGWSIPGRYGVKVKAIDINGSSSGWSDSLSVGISDTDEGEDEGEDKGEGLPPLLLFVIIVIVIIVIVTVAFLAAKSKKRA